jgi:hypothetical protein
MAKSRARGEAQKLSEDCLEISVTFKSLSMSDWVTKERKQFKHAAFCMHLLKLGMCGKNTHIRTPSKPPIGGLSPNPE